MPPQDRADIHDRRHGGCTMGVEVMLTFQEQIRVGVLRSMAEEVERRHECNGIQRQLPLARNDSRQAVPLLADAVLDEHRRFVHRHADEEHQNSRHDAQQKHVAPAECAVKQEGRDGGQEIAAGIARLQQARNHAARAQRYGFERQSGADAPLASHRNAEQASERQKDRQRGRKSGSCFQDREGQNIPHQRGLASEAIGEPPENEGPDRPCRERQ